MSKPRPFTPKAVELPRADDPTTCEGCRHWRDQGGLAGPGRFGLCVVDPPSHRTRVTPAGPLCVYPVTTADTLACGQGEPK